MNDVIVSDNPVHTPRRKIRRGAGKGDNRRPQSVDRETFASNWERTFGRKPAVGIEPTTSRLQGACSTD